MQDEIWKSHFENHARMSFITNPSFELGCSGYICNANTLPGWSVLSGQVKFRSDFAAHEQKYSLDLNDNGVPAVISQEMSPSLASAKY